MNTPTPDDEVVLLIQCEEIGCGQRWDRDDFPDDISFQAATLTHPHFMDEAAKELA